MLCSTLQPLGVQLDLAKHAVLFIVPVPRGILSSIDPCIIPASFRRGCSQLPWGLQSYETSRSEGPVTKKIKRSPLVWVLRTVNDDD